MNQYGYSFEKLDKNKHDRYEFDCGVDVLNLFLKTRANQEQNKNLSVTYVCRLHDKQPKSKIIGYYTLSNSALSQTLLNLSETKAIPPTYEVPTIKIGRMAIDKNFQGKGVGTNLLKSALFKILEISQLSGIKGIEVNAKNIHVEKFYASFGFIALSNTDDLMFLPIETVKKCLTNAEELII